MKLNKSKQAETKPVVPNNEENITPERVCERAAETHDVICSGNEENEKLVSAFIKCGVNPVDAVIVQSDSPNIYDIAGQVFNKQSAYLNDAFASEDTTVYDMASLDLFRNTMKEHFSLLSLNAITESINLANIQFTNAIKGGSPEAKAVLDLMYVCRYLDYASSNIFYEPFKLPTIILGTRNLYDTTDADIPALTDLTLYRMCDITTILTSVIARLEGNFNQFKNYLAETIRDNNMRLSDIDRAVAYETIIYAYNMCQVKLLERLEKVVMYLEDESLRIHRAGLPGFTSIDPIELYDEMRNERGSMTVDPDTGKILGKSDER